MALILKDRISETTTTAGTGTLTLGGALSGFQPFSSIGNTNTTYYCITDTTAWEVGLGTYSSSGNTLARTTVLSNSNGNTSPITLAAGTKTVFSVYPAERAIVVDGATIQIPNSAVLPLANGGTGSSTAAFSGSNITDLNATAITAGTISNSRTTASSSNGASSIVERDATGNFSTNVITANSYSGSGASLTSLNASSVSSGTLSAANGGTGQTSLTANNVILGNGTSSVLFVSPGASGNVLTSDGTTWASTTPAAGSSGWQVLASGSFTGTTVDITGLPTTNGIYAINAEIVLGNISAVHTFGLRMSYDNGATYKAASSDYNVSLSFATFLPFMSVTAGTNTFAPRIQATSYYINTDAGSTNTPYWGTSTFTTSTALAADAFTNVLTGGCRIAAKPSALRIIRLGGTTTALAGSRYTVYRVGNLT